MTKPLEIHPYDGRERRYRDDDLYDQGVGRALVERCVGLPLEDHAVRYDLSFYSGGIGVLDRLRISVAAADAWRATARARGFAPAAEALAHEQVRWLVVGDDGDDPDDAGDAADAADGTDATERALVAFIAAHKAPFQPAAFERAWIQEDSDVNTWALVYEHDGWIHYLAHDQG